MSPQPYAPPQSLGGQEAPQDPQSMGPGAGGGFPSPAPAQADPRAAQAGEWILQIVSLSRRIGMMYPQTTQEVRAINDAAARMQPKLLSEHPSPEAQSPPV
jgi:hypothetical protein